MMILNNPEDTGRSGLAADPLDASCPAHEVLELVSNKWAVSIFRELRNGPRRNSELKRAIPGITQKMLTQTLRHFEGNGLVSRRIFAVVPPRVEYSLTPLGASLVDPLRGVCRWAESHWTEVEFARAAFNDNPQP